MSEFPGLFWCAHRGDQGFLNSYFSGFPAAPLFDPLAPVTDEKVKMMRLPTAYNADAGLYVINSMRRAHYLFPELG